jgi:hypothetical protein
MNSISKLKIIRGFIAILLISSVPILSNADCFDALKRCENECNTSGLLFDIESGKLINAHETDFIGNCKDACRRGKRYCENESNSSDGCYEFKRKCRNQCPSAVMNFRNGNILLLTDANSKCEDACHYGYRRCE